LSDSANGTHFFAQAPSPWVLRWVGQIPRGAEVLDVACGRGRHARMLAELGYRVHAVDRDGEALAQLAGVAGIVPRQADLEAGIWPYAGRSFDGIVVTNYLFRPLLPVLVRSVSPQGILLYETFAVGNEVYGRPSNPAFLLQPGELLDAVRGILRVVAYEDLKVDDPRPAMVQRICARRCAGP
jgi:SAM-dependent methyltransferase